MMHKLAFRNVRRMIKDYLVYFITMSVVTALMFSFNILLFSEDIQELFEMADTMAIMTGIATFFVVIIIAWLMNYMVSFVLQKRSQEFAIYLLSGMKKKEITKLYFQENILLGIGAFFVGMGIGVLFQQILLSVFYSIIQMNYHLHLEFNWKCTCMTALCYGGCYLIALFRCKRKFKKMNIHDLMESQKRNERIEEKDEKWKKLFFPLSILFFIVFGLFLFCYRHWDTGVMLVFIVGLVLTIYLFYIGISAWISYYVRTKGKAIYYRDTLFLLRQFSTKIKTLSFTMGTLTALFTLALLGSSVAFMFNHFQNQVLVNKFPFDIQVHSGNVNDNFDKEISLLKKETKVKEVYKYNIYENETNVVNTYLYTHLEEFGDEYKKSDGTIDVEEIKENEEMAYCDYDTYMGLSDYNHLRKMLNLPEIVLQENEYAIHMKERVFNQVKDFHNQLVIKNGTQPLIFSGYYIESFSQDGHNGGDYILVVPDSVLQGMKPYYREMVADIAGIAPANLQNKLDALETKEEELNNFCMGSDSVVVYVSKNLVKDNLIQEVKYMLSSIIFPLFYIGLVFLCVSLTVLSVQQLSDSVKYKFRYRVLAQIGYSQKEINRIILKQLIGYYLCPALMALFISGLIAIYVGKRFVFYTGVHTSPAEFFLIATVLFFGIYFIYFIVTYIGFKRNIEQECLK